MSPPSTEVISMSISVNGQSVVPPGFRFHPTEEELLTYYLNKKVASERIDLDVIRDVDLNKLEPWDIQEHCRIGSGPQNYWYFFSHKEKKYQKGTRTNRTTAAGYWHATGRDKAIYSCPAAADHSSSSYSSAAASSSPMRGVDHQSNAPGEGWVICRVFKKKNLVHQSSGAQTSGPVAPAAKLLASTESSPRNCSTVTTVAGDGGFLPAAEFGGGCSVE